jgi:hypothetical protein
LAALQLSFSSAEPISNPLLALLPFLRGVEIVTCGQIDLERVSEVVHRLLEHTAVKHRCPQSYPSVDDAQVQ